MDDLTLHHDTALVLAVTLGKRKDKKIQRTVLSLLMNLVGTTSYWHTVAEVMEMGQRNEVRHSEMGCSELTAQVCIMDVFGDETRRQDWIGGSSID
jgi:hypothetical protein